MLVLLFVVLWFILRGDLFYVLPCVILFLCFFSPFSIAITSLGEERANLSAFCTFVRFVLVWIVWFPLPPGVWQGLRFVYRFRKIVGKSNFSEQFRTLINRYKRISYSLDIMRQTGCLVVNPIIVDGYASLFNCTTAVRTSDPVTASS